MWNLQFIAIPIHIEKKIITPAVSIRTFIREYLKL